MTAVVSKFDGTDTVAAVVAIDALGIATGDFTFNWRIGNSVFIAKVTPP